MIEYGLNDLLLEKNISKTELAKSTGLRIQAITNLADGVTKKIPVTTLDCLCKYFDCDVNDIISYKKNPVNPIMFEHIGSNKSIKIIFENDYFILSSTDDQNTIFDILLNSAIDCLINKTDFDLCDDIEINNSRGRLLLADDFIVIKEENTNPYSYNLCKNDFIEELLLFFLSNPHRFVTPNWNRINRMQEDKRNEYIAKFDGKAKRFVDMCNFASSLLTGNKDAYTEEEYSKLMEKYK